MDEDTRTCLEHIYNSLLRENADFRRSISGRLDAISSQIVTLTTRLDQLEGHMDELESTVREGTKAVRRHHAAFVEALLKHGNSQATGPG